MAIRRGGSVIRICTSGVLFTDARFSRSDAAGAWSYRVAADNVGYRDQRYFGNFERAGRFTITGLWDQIPQFYSTDTKTPFTTSVSPLLLDDATQLRIQNGQANSSAYIPIATQFDLRERRDIGTLNFLATPTPQLDVKAAFTSTRHRGELPWGASFGFSNDVEVSLPYNSRTNDVNVGAEWTNTAQHAARGLQRVVVRQHRRDARMGQPAAPDRLDGGARARAHGPVAVQ